MKKLYNSLTHLGQNFKNKTTATKNKSFLTTLLLLFMVNTMMGQVATTYTFSESNGTYTAITGGTQLVTTTAGAVSHDTSVDAISLGTSTFNFNGTSVSSVTMTADGAIFLGTTTAANSSGPIASSTTATGVIAALGMDLRSTSLTGQVYERRWQDTGTEVVFQWQNAARSSQNTTERFSFQIRINKSTGVINIVYGNMTTIANSTTNQPQVGLRGATNADFNIRRLTATVPDSTPNWGAPNGTTAGSNNSHTCRFTTGSPSCVPSSGLTFTYTPAPACVAPTAQATAYTAGAVATTSIGGSFTAATGAPTGYLVVRSPGALSVNPANGTTYTAGGSLGNGTIVQASATTSFTASSLISNTAYTFTTFSYNSAACSGGPVYFNTAPLSATATTCASTPTAGTATAISTSGATIGWTAATGGSAGTINCILNVFTDAARTVHISGSPFSMGTSVSQTISGLTPATTYYTRVVANNGTCNSGNLDGSFTTLCIASTIPYNVPLTAVTVPAIPACTTVENVNADASTWKSAAAQTGITGNVMQYTYHGSNVANDWFYTNKLTLTAGTSYRLKFKFKDSGYAEKLKVAIGSSTANATMTTTLGDYTTGVLSAVVPIVIDFTVPTSGDFNIGFQCYSAANMYYLYLGEISVELTPSCFEPTALTNTNITSTTASHSWTAPAVAPATGYEWAVTTSATPPASGTATTALTASSTALAAATTHYLHVRSDCGASGQSAWATKSFVTACAIPNAPSAVVTSNVTSIALTVGLTAATPTPTGYMLFMSTTTTAIPTLVDGTTYTAGQSYTLGGNSYLCVISSNTSTSWNLVNAIPNTQYNYFAFAINSGTCSRTYSTGVTGFATTCAATPTLPTATAVTINSATIGWTTPTQGAVGVVTSTLEVYTDAGYTTHISGSPFTALSGNSQALAGLSPGTTYYYRVKANNTFCDSTYLTGSFVTICLPESITSTTPGVVCGTGTVALAATASGGANVNWYTAATGGTAVASGNTYTTPILTTTTNYFVGAGVVSSSSVATGAGVTTSLAAGVSPFYHAYGGAKTQYIYRASELTALGLTAGNITQLSIPITTLGTTPLNGFSINIGHTTQNVAVSNAAITTGLTSVYTNAAQALALGTNAFNLATPFNWNGTSNIVISISYSNNNAGGTSSTVATTTASFVSSLALYSDNAAPNCMLNAASSGASCFDFYDYGNTTASIRPNISLFGQVICESPRTQVVATVNTAPTLTLSANSATACSGSDAPLVTLSGASSYDTFVWSPSTNVAGSAAAGYTFNPSTTTTYTLTASQSSGSLCSTTATFTYTATAVPTALDITNTNEVVCLNKLQTITASGGLVSLPAVLLTELANVLPTTLTRTNIAGTGTATLNTTYFTEGTGSVLLTAGSSANIAYASNANVDLTGATSANITFSHIAAMEGPTTSYDYGFVEYSTDGGATWIAFVPANYVGSAATAVFDSTVVRFSAKSYANWTTAFTSASSLPTNSLWQSESLNIPVAALTSSQFRIRFRFTTDSGTNYYGWLIDNLKITKVAPTSQIVWSSPDASLFTDAAGTIGYTAPGTYPTTIYAKPTANNAVITATSTVGSCSKSDSVTYSTGTSIYANGAWDVPPAANRSLIINGSYTVGADLAACDCTVNAGTTTVGSNVTLSLTNGITQGGSLIFENNSSLLQENTSATINTGSITYNRTTPALNNNFDFVYWSSPVANQTIKNMWMTTANDTFYSFDATIPNWAYVAPGTVMQQGVGYIARAVTNSANATGSNTSTWATGGTWNSPFIGVPNNGNVQVNVHKVGSAADNLLGNPYPSALDLQLLKTDNAALAGTYFFWNHSTALTNNTYDAAGDYAIFNANVGVNGTGTAATSGGTAPDKFVDAGQSFFATAAATGTVTFKNSQRVSGNNNAFYRMANTAANQSSASNALWLNLKGIAGTATAGAFKQQFVGYVQNSTNNFDAGYDVASYNGNPNIDFYSIIPNYKLVMQCRDYAFTPADVVPLGFTTVAGGTFKIAIDHTNNNDAAWFAGQRVYLQDNLLGLDFDLTNADYTFTTIAGSIENRFVLKYTSTLSTETLDYLDNSVVIASNKNTLKIKSVIEDISKITIFDMLGREVYKKEAIHAKDFVAANIVANQQTLIVKITLANGAIVSKKIIY